ncbi:hypothetical protein CLOM_g10394, partial [Closterium sp. NIES-68]
GADEPTTGPATTAGLRTPSSAARGAEERGGGTAREGGQGGVAAGGFSSSGKLGVKQWQHDRFLEFLQASGAQQELAVRQPLALQLILEHGERLAAVAHLRTLHSSLAATASNLQQQLQQQHQQQMQRQGSPSPFASPYLQSPAPKAASPLPQTPTSASAAAARAGEGYDEQVGEEARMEREREAAEVAATSLWRVVQDAGDRIRRGSVFLLERDRSQVFFARTSEAGLEFFSALAAAFSDAAGAVERGRKDDAWAAGNRAATMTAAAAAGAAGAAGVTQSGKKPALFTPGKFNEAQGDPSTGTGETAAVAAAAGSPFLPAYLTTPAPGTPTLSHFPSPSPFSTPSHFPPPAATSAAAATGVGVSASAAAAAARRHLARAATLVEAAVGSLGAADRYRTDKARWYPDLGRLAGSDLGGVRRAKGRGRKRRGGRGVGGVRGGRVRGGGGGGGIGDMWRWVERWEPWACSGAVRAALWSLVATLIQLESTAQWDEDQLSLLHRLSLSLSSLLLSAFATALEARDVAGKGEQEGEEEQQEREVLEKEYFWKRDFLLSVLVQRAIGAAEASEDPSAALRASVAAPFALARQHCSYATLFHVCRYLQDVSLLETLMRDIPSGPEGRFTFFVFSQFTAAGDTAGMMRFGPAFPTELEAFLEDHKHLQWLHDILLGNFPKAASTLHALASSFPAAQSLMEQEARCQQKHGGRARSKVGEKSGEMEQGGEEGGGERMDGGGVAAMGLSVLRKRKKLMQLAKLSFLAGSSGPSSLTSRAAVLSADIEIRLLEIQEAAMSEGLAGPGPIGALELASALLPASRPLLLLSFEVFAIVGPSPFLHPPPPLDPITGTSSLPTPGSASAASPADRAAAGGSGPGSASGKWQREQRKEAVRVLKRAWVAAAEADDWDEMRQRSEDEGWTDAQFVASLRSSVLFTAAQLLYSHHPFSSSAYALPSSSSSTSSSSSQSSFIPPQDPFASAQAHPLHAKLGQLETFEAVLPLLGQSAGYGNWAGEGAGWGEEARLDQAGTVEEVLKTLRGYPAVGEAMLSALRLGRDQGGGVRDVRWGRHVQMMGGGGDAVVEEMVE